MNLSLCNRSAASPADPEFVIWANLPQTRLCRNNGIVFRIARFSPAIWKQEKVTCHTYIWALLSSDFKS
jgi:hypothetical protein